MRVFTNNIDHYLDSIAPELFALEWSKYWFIHVGEVKIDDRGKLQLHDEGGW